MPLNRWFQEVWELLAAQIFEFETKPDYFIYKEEIQTSSQQPLINQFCFSRKLISSKTAIKVQLVSLSLSLKYYMRYIFF